jgi:hypothetical protein
MLLDGLIQAVEGRNGENLLGKKAFARPKFGLLQLDLAHLDYCDAAGSLSVSGRCIPSNLDCDRPGWQLRVRICFRCLKKCIEPQPAPITPENRIAPERKACMRLDSEALRVFWEILHSVDITHYYLEIASLSAFAHAYRPIEASVVLNSTHHVASRSAVQANHDLFAAHRSHFL